MLARSYRLNFLLETFRVLVTLGVFFYLGELLDDSELEARLGVEGDYFAFAAVGIAVLLVVQTTIDSFSTRLRADQTVGTLEALIATPAPTWLVILGSATYDVLRALLLGVAMILMAVAFFGLRPSLDGEGVLVLLVAVPALVTLFAALGVAIAAFTVVFKQATALGDLVTAALSLLGGVYFPLSVLPSAVEGIASALPFTWGVEAVRAALLGEEIELDEVSLLVASSLVGLPLALALFARAVHAAKRMGTLADY